MEIGAEGGSDFVYLCVVELISVFRAGESYACPGCVDVDPEGGVVLGCREVGLRFCWCVGWEGDVPTCLISGKLSTAPDDVVPTVATTIHPISASSLEPIHINHSLSINGCLPFCKSSSSASRRASPRRLYPSSALTSIARTFSPRIFAALRPRECVWVVV